MKYFIGTIKIIAYFVIMSLANYMYPGSQYLAQGIVLIAFWGTWFQNNKNNDFAQKYGKFFNWVGLLGILNGIYFFVK